MVFIADKKNSNNSLQIDELKMSFISFMFRSWTASAKSR